MLCIHLNVWPTVTIVVVMCVDLLSDLSFAVEELRHDVLERGCRVNREEVQTMALTLGNISKNLSQLKGKFPELQTSMKTVMAGEMEVVVKEEK